MLVARTNGKQLGGLYLWCSGGGEQFEEKVMSWAHMAKGTTKRLFQAGTALSEACSLWGLGHQGREEFGFSTEGTGSHIKYGAWRGMDSSWAGMKGWGGPTNVGSEMGVCLST